MLRIHLPDSSESRETGSSYELLNSRRSAELGADLHSCIPSPAPILRLTPLGLVAGAKHFV